MASFDEFCAAYDLDADAPDTALQFEQYQDAYGTLMAIVGKNTMQNSTGPA